MMISRSSLSLAIAMGLAAPLLSQGSMASSHTVTRGDTLWDIARTYMGDAFLWPQIYKLNTDVVENPHWIYPGEVLKLVALPGQTAVPTTDTPAPVGRRDAPAGPTVEPTMPAAEPAVQGGPDQDDGLSLFRRPRVANVRNAFKTYREVKYHPLRSGEFYSAGFLSEGDTLPFGRFLGPVTPEQIESARSRAAVQLFTVVGIQPPAGASYAVGDTLVIVDRHDGPIGYGEILVPTGLIRITGQNGNQAVGDVVAVYWPIRDGQRVLPAEKFSDPGAVQYRAVSQGVEGRVLAPRDLREMRHPQDVLFIDIGSKNGVVVGDLFQARRTPGPQDQTEANAVDELMATLQVVHVRTRSATVKVINVLSPHIPLGTRVKLVAKLPS
jgi:hypothetical protein